MEKCADEQAGGDDKNKREGNFRDEQRAANFLASWSGAGALPAFFQSLDEIFACSAERGGEPEEQAGEKNDAERERKYARIEPDFMEPGNIQRAEGFHELNRELAEEETGDSAKEREQHALG